MVLMELADVKAERDKLRNQLESRSNEEKLKARFICVYVSWFMRDLV